jgi:hypothetical protein
VNEFHDPELERLLGRASGAYPDTNVAFEAVRGRVRQVKRRRALLASTATCVLVAGVVALAVRGGADDGRVEPSTRSGVTTPEVEPTTPETQVSTPETEMAPETTIAETTVATVMMGSGGSGAAGTPVTSGNRSSNSGKGSANSGKSTTTSTVATIPPVQPTTPTEVVTSYSSKGGSVAVQLVNHRLVLVGTTPAAGYSAHPNEVSGDRIRVEFSNGTLSYEVQLELSDGRISNSIQTKGS